MPWTIGSQSFYDSVIEAIAERYEIPLDDPWRELTPEQQDKFLYGTGGDKIFVTYRNRMGRKRQYTMAFEGLVTNLERRYKETDSSQQRERIEEYMSFRPCPTCGGARLKPEVLAVTIGEKSIHEFTRMSVTRALLFLDELELTKTEELIGRRIVKEVRERLTFLDNVGVGYLQLDRAAKTLSGGEAQRLRLATQIGSQLVGRPVHPRRALDRAPPAGQRQTDRDARAAPRPREHRARRRARRADDAVGRLAGGHGPGRGRARRRGRRGRDGGRRRGDRGIDHGPVPERRAAHRGAAAARRRRPRLVRRARRVDAQPQGRSTSTSRSGASSRSRACRARGSRRS